MARVCFRGRPGPPGCVFFGFPPPRVWGLRLPEQVLQGYVHGSVPPSANDFVGKETAPVPDLIQRLPLLFPLWGPKEVSLKALKTSAETKVSVGYNL